MIVLLETIGCALKFQTLVSNYLIFTPSHLIIHILIIAAFNLFGIHSFVCLHYKSDNAGLRFLSKAYSGVR